MNRKSIATELVRLAKQLVSAEKPSVEEVAKFFADNPNPPDSKLHKWAEEKGYDVHEVETLIYTFATKYAEFFNDGKANERGFKKEEADAKELKMGIAVEHEHTPNSEVAERIAIDHLSEIPDYYTRLKKMEEEAGIKD